MSMVSVVPVVPVVPVVSVASVSVASVSVARGANSKLGSRGNAGLPSVRVQNYLMMQWHEDNVVRGQCG